MSRNLSEGNINKDVAANEFGTRQLFRRPAPPAATGGEMSWMSLYDDTPLGQPYATTSGVTNLAFPYIDWSDNALTLDGGPFSYTTVSGTTPFGKTYAYRVQINVKGIYAITLSVISEDMNATKDYKVKLGVDVSGDYPGRQGSDPTLWAGQSVLNQDFSTGYFYIENTWVLPIKAASPPKTFFPVFGVQVSASEVGTKNWTLRNKMWVTYLSDDHYATTSFPAEKDPGAWPP